MRNLLFALLVAALPLGLFGHLAGAEGPGPDAGAGPGLPFWLRLALVSGAALLYLAAYRLRSGLLGPGLAAALALVAWPSLPDAVATPLAQGRLWLLPLWGAALLLVTRLSAGAPEGRVRLRSLAVAGSSFVAAVAATPGAEKFGAEALRPNLLAAGVMAVLAGEVACLLARRGEPGSPARRALVAGLSAVILASAALGQVRAHAWRDAVSFWDRAVLESPRSPAALGASAGARADAGDRAGVADRLRRTAEAVAAGEGRRLGPEADRLGALGVARGARLLFEGGTPEEVETAEASLRAALELAPGSVPVLVALSDARLSRGDFLEPLRLLEAAVALDRGSAEAWDALARARLAARSLPEALEAARRATGLKPMDRRFAVTWAEALLTAGKGGEALTALRRVLGQEPPYDPVVARAYADTELRLAREDVSAGRPGRARRKLLSAGEVDRGHGACADFLRELDREMAAERPEYERLLEKDAAGKVNPDNWLRFIIWLCRWGEFEEADLHFRRLLALRPNSAPLRFHHGLEFWEGRGSVEGAEKAVEAYLAAIALDARYVDAWNRLWHCQRDLGRTREAVAAARRFCELDPTHPDVVDALEFLEGR